MQRTCESIARLKIGGALGSQWLGSQWTPLSPRLFAWQAWHLATSTCILRGRHGTYGTGRGTRRHRRALGVGGVALGDIDVHSAWQAWHLRHWAGSGGALGSQWTPLSPRLFAWQAWHSATLTSTWRGRRGPWRHRRAFYVAGVVEHKQRTKCCNLQHFALSDGKNPCKYHSFSPRKWLKQCYLQGFVHVTIFENRLHQDKKSVQKVQEMLSFTRVWHRRGQKTA